MKNTRLFLSLIIFLCFVSRAYSKDYSCSDNNAFLVFDEKSKNILLAENAGETFYPASLVKLMTLYLTFEAIEKHHLFLDSNLEFSERAERVSKVNKVNSLFIKEGEKITVEQAIKAVIVKSFNEAAVVLAEGVAEDEWSFVRKMNEKARELKMDNTSFRNASGLHEEGQYTTTNDLARLVLALREDFPKYYYLFATKDFTFNGKKYLTHNKVLLDYKGAEGLKTGFTKASGFNLISAAKRQDVRLISVLLGCAKAKERDKLTENLLNAAFDEVGREECKPEDLNKEVRFAVKLSNGFDY